MQRVATVDERTPRTSGRDCVEIARSNARVQDRAAATEMFRLLVVILRAPQIDEVEVGVLDFGAAQVGAAEVGFSDFFGRAVELLVEFVGVKTGARALAGDRAVHQSAPRRAGME